MERRAEAVAQEGNKDKEKILKEMMQREKQQETAKKLRYLRGKLFTGSTTMVTKTDSNGKKVDITEKTEIEKAILKNNEEKFKQSSKNPFLSVPLRDEMGFKGTGPATKAVLQGTYRPEFPIDPYAEALIYELKTPQEVLDLPFNPMTMETESYIAYWRKAKENISCYPSDLSFSTMKAGSFSPLIAEFECSIT